MMKKCEKPLVEGSFVEMLEASMKVPFGCGSPPARLLHAVEALQCKAAPMAQLARKRKAEAE